MSKERPVRNHDRGEPVVFDPRLMREGDKETDIYQMVLTPAEQSAAPAVIHLKGQSVKVICKVDRTPDCFLMDMEVRSAVTMLDDHDLKPKKTQLAEQADLALSADKDMADILPDRNGTYDLRPTALALFYSSVPTTFSTVGLTKVEGEGFEILSQAEYDKEEAQREEERRKDDNPFAKAFGKGK